MRTANCKLFFYSHLTVGGRQLRKDFKETERIHLTASPSIATPRARVLAHIRASTRVHHVTLAPGDDKCDDAGDALHPQPTAPPKCIRASTRVHNVVLAPGDDKRDAAGDALHRQPTAPPECIPCTLASHEEGGLQL